MGDEVEGGPCVGGGEWRGVLGAVLFRHEILDEQELLDIADRVRKRFPDEDRPPERK